MGYKAIYGLCIGKVNIIIKSLKDNKKAFKLEVDDVLEMLNDNLRYELKVALNAKMLNSTNIFKIFGISFNSELTEILRQETFTLDENIFNVSYLLR